jgi:hypothetical protein
MIRHKLKRYFAGTNRWYDAGMSLVSVLRRALVLINFVISVLYMVDLSSCA